MTTESLLSARHDACYILKHRSQAKGWLIAGGQGAGSISLGSVFPKTEHMAGTQKATSEKLRVKNNNKNLLALALW